MKDIVITPLRIRKELITLLVLFLIGFIANIVAIIVYKTHFIEIITSVPYVVLFSLVAYFLWLLVRIIFYLISRVIKQKHL
ncbi:MAG: hypothetical protein JW798_18825 [Prolixibacteraceae bacterium]|nr:hypothetical protein [Prolixibacteraceae bacterium]